MTILGFIFLITEVKDPATGSVLKCYFLSQILGGWFELFLHDLSFSICVNGVIVVGWSQSDFADSHIFLT